MTKSCAYQHCDNVAEYLDCQDDQVCEDCMEREINESDAVEGDFESLPNTKWNSDIVVASPEEQEIIKLRKAVDVSLEDRKFYMIALNLSGKREELEYKATELINKCGDLLAALVKSR
jgi:hypothetical protein